MDQSQQGSGSTQKQPTPLSTNLQIPLPTLTHAIQALAKRAQTREQKHYLFVVAEGLGTAIQSCFRGAGGGNVGGGGPNGGFTAEGFMSDCGVDPEWATIAA